MIENEIFTNNLLALMEKNRFNAKTLSELINIRRGKKTIDHSYIAKMVKNAREGIHANPSLDKATNIANGFDMPLSKFLHINCVDEAENALSFDSATLEAAFRHTDSFCGAVDNDSPDFKAKVFEIQYWSLVSGNVGEGSAKLALLAKEYKI
jgi:transcriptional regulator with XRE-family HTH domain